MQLKSFVAFSASAFVSKSAGVLFLWKLLEHPITKNDVEIIMVVKMGLRLFISIVLSFSSSFRLIKL